MFKVKKNVGRYKKNHDFCPRDIESCHHAAARRVELWSLNVNLLFKEPHQLTKFACKTFSCKALIAIFCDLQPLWPSSPTKPDLLRFRCSSVHVPSKTKSVSHHFLFTVDITNSSSLNGKIFRKKSMLENFRANFPKQHIISCPCHIFSAKYPKSTIKALLVDLFRLYTIRGTKTAF